MQGTDFLLAPRYGEILNVAALAMVFAATMPLMLFIVAPMLALAFFLQLAELLQGADLADMALKNIPLMITMHLAWSLWAFSFLHIDAPPAVDLSYLLKYTVVPVATFMASSDSADALVARITQAHSLPLLVALLLSTAALLVVILLGSNLLHSLLYPLLVPVRIVVRMLHALHVLRPRSIQRSRTEAQSDSVAAFNVALRTHLLIGPSSYTLADNPHYHQAFSTRHWNPAERRRKREQLWASTRPRNIASVRTSSHGAAAAPLDGLSDDDDDEVQAPAEEWKAHTTALAEAAVAKSTHSDTRSQIQSDTPRPLPLPEASFPAAPEHTHSPHPPPEEEHSFLQPPMECSFQAGPHTHPPSVGGAAQGHMGMGRGWGPITAAGRLEAVKASKESKKAKVKEMFALDLDIEAWDP